jgi:hypothetical protein
LARFCKGEKREWRNRQTRTVQVRVLERVWGFNSPLAHQENGSLLTLNVSREPSEFSSSDTGRVQRVTAGYEGRHSTGDENHADTAIFFVDHTPAPVDLVLSAGDRKVGASRPSEENSVRPGVGALEFYM